jgi:hypothetical protein
VSNDNYFSRRRGGNTKHEALAVGNAISSGIFGGGIKRFGIDVGHIDL